MGGLQPSSSKHKEKSESLDEMFKDIRENKFRNESLVQICVLTSFAL